MAAPWHPPLRTRPRGVDPYVDHELERPPQAVRPAQDRPRHPRQRRRIFSADYWLANTRAAAWLEQLNRDQLDRIDGILDALAVWTKWANAGQAASPSWTTRSPPSPAWAEM